MLFGKHKYTVRDGPGTQTEPSLTVRYKSFDRKGVFYYIINDMDKKDYEKYLLTPEEQKRTSSAHRSAVTLFIGLGLLAFGGVMARLMIGMITGTEPLQYGIIAGTAAPLLLGALFVIGGIAGLVKKGRAFKEEENHEAL